jgi:signal transduction histidine kinase/FixJ family two-component response regulator
MSRLLRVLIVEDSENDAALLVREIRRGQCDVVSERVETPTAMRAALAKQSWDIVISDYSMPHFSAPAALKVVQEAGVDLPFIIVSGAIGEDSAVAAMKDGAHDYLMKGKLARLMPAIERELREAGVRQERQRIEEENRGNLQRIRALHEINTAIASTLDLRTVLDILLDKIDFFVPYAAMSVRLFNPNNGLLEPVACRNLDEEQWKLSPWRPGHGLANLVFETEAPLIIDNLQEDPRVRNRDFFRKHGFASYLGVPLAVKQEILGVLSFYTQDQHEFAHEEMAFLSTLASQAAMAIHNAQLYEQIQHQAVALEKSNKVKDEFLSVMSHELRTPLNLIMGYTSTVKDGIFGDINPEQQKALGKALNHSKDLLSMISGILYVTDIETDEVQMESHPFPLSDFLLELKVVFDLHENKQVRVIWDYSSDLPCMQTDREKLKQILQNLIHNAIKFTDSGKVTVSARLKDAVENRIVKSEKFVEFKVADTGIGISDEKLPIIFEMFRQVDSSETRGHEGVGLGLYIAKRFTEVLRGTIEVESTLNKGSTFTVTIPCVISPSRTGETKENQELERESTQVSSSASNLRHKNLEER